MLAEDGLDLAGNLGCDCEVIGVEAAVDLAAQTVDVRYLLEVEVFDPVLDGQYAIDANTTISLDLCTS